MTKRSRSVELLRRHADNEWIPFDSIRSLLPDRVADWPNIQCLEDISVTRLMHRFYRFCFLCMSESDIEAHHIFGGAHRSDELTNILMVCYRCHKRIQSDPKCLREVLMAKWTWDRIHTNWRRMLLLHGRWFDFDTLRD